VDITERKLAENELRKSEEKFRRIVETTGEGFIMMDEDLTIVDVNDAYCRMLGLPRQDILGKSPLDLAAPEFREFMAANRDRMLAMDYRTFEGALIARDGRRVPVLIHGNTLRSDDGKKMGNIAFVTDLTDQKKALALAGKVQKSLNPGKAPRIEGLDIAGRSAPCDEVGGDYYDFLFGPEYPSNSLKIVIGDIAGHGVDAALLMTSARAFIRMRAAQPGRPSEVVRALNRDLSLDMEGTSHFMTLFYIDIDPAERTAHWVRAGHDPALIYLPAEDRFEELTGTGLALGVDLDFTYLEYALPALAPGTLIAMGTDGIWEARDIHGRVFGKHRLKNTLREHADKPSDEIITVVFETLSRFRKGLPADDDITLVIVKVS
jgi:sigma-B regulation protein RsbU (phosphoserine phosphatase)